MDFRTVGTRRGACRAASNEFIQTEIDPIEAEYHAEIKRRRDAGQGENWLEQPAMERAPSQGA